MSLPFHFMAPDPHRAAALNLRRLTNLGLTHTDNTWTLTNAPA
jgi:hypothetical protein